MLIDGSNFYMLANLVRTAIMFLVQLLAARSLGIENYGWSVAIMAPFLMLQSLFGTIYAENFSEYAKRSLSNGESPSGAATFFFSR